MLVTGAIFVFLNVKNMSESEIAKASADMARSAFDILSPVLIRREAKTLVEWAADTALVNQKLRMNLPTDVRSLTRAQAREMVYLEREVAEQQATFWGRLKKKFSISPRFARFIGIALGAVVVGFLIWDLCNSWSRLSGTGKALSVLQIILESGAVVCAIIGLFSACSIIPVIGQVCMVLALVVAILLIFFGQPEREKTPGENFVDSMKDPNNGWLSKIDDPPAPLLDYTISPTDVPKNGDYSLQITAKNNTGHDIEIIAEAGNKPLSQTELVSVKFSFTTGTDKACLFGNKSFSDAADAKDGKFSFTGPNGVFKTTVLPPNGSGETLTGYDFRVFRAQSNLASNLTLANGASFTMTVAGKGGSGDKDFTLKIIEERPGAACALKVQTLYKK
jgi:hypothetical protein